MKKTKKIYLIFIGVITAVFLTILLIKIVPKKSNEITLNLNTGDDSSIEYKTMATTIGDIEVPTKNGYLFVGWYDNSLFFGDELDSTSKLKNNETLYAKWNPKKFSISFANTYSDKISNITKDYQSNITKPTDPVRPGYQFLGWYLDSDLKTNFKFSTMPANDIVLYAAWGKKTYHIEVETSIYGTCTGNGDYKFDSLVTLICLPNKGYKFVGWYSNSNFSGEVLSTELEYSFSCPSNNVELYAKYEETNISTELDVSIEDIIYGNILKINIIKNTLPGNLVFEFKETTLPDSAYRLAEPKDVGQYVVKAYIEGSDKYITRYFEIKKAAYDMSDVQFKDVSYIYNGSLRKLEVSGILPVGLSVVYSSNTLTSVGVKHVTATFTGSTNYLPVEDLTATLSITKKELEVTYVSESIVLGVTPSLSLNFVGFVDGESTNNLDVVPSVKSLSESIGIYELVPSGGSSSNYSFVYISGVLEITDRVYDMSSVSFTDKSYCYDGNEHEIVIDGNLPSNVTVHYTNNKLISAGSIKVTASFIGEEGYLHIPDLIATLTITKALLSVTYEGEKILYGETPSLDLTITGFVSYDSVDILEEKPYIFNSNTLVGTYTLTPKDAVSINYAFVYYSGELVIEKATYDLTNIRFADQELNYDGTGHSIFISGTLPIGVSVYYINNYLIETGNTVVTAKFEGDINYNPISDIKATLSINKVDLSVSYLGEKVVYGDSPSLLIEFFGFVNNETKENIESLPIIENENKNVGVYNLTPTGGVSRNYKFTYLSGNLEITKATYDMSGVSFVNQEFVYDGTKKRIFIDGDLPEGVSETYSFNELTIAGTLEVSVTFLGSSNYNYITGLTATLTILKKELYVTYISETVNQGEEPELLISITGFVDGEDISNLDYEPSVNNQYSEAGEYELAPEGGSSNNYNFIYFSGTLTIIEN